MNSSIWIVDFGSQYTQLITRKFRELGFTSEIITLEEGLERIKTNRPKALVLSGGRRVFLKTRPIIALS